MALILHKKKWANKPEGFAKLGNDLIPRADFLSAYIFQHNCTLPLIRNEITNETGIDYGFDGAEFDGSTSEIQLDAPIGLAGYDECTLILELRKGATGNNDGIWGDKRNTNWADDEGIDLNLNTTGGILFYVNDVVAVNTSTNYFNDLKFHTLICQYKAGELTTCYVDGVEITYSTQDNGPTNYVNSSLDARIGTYYDSSSARTATGRLKYLYVIKRKIPLETALKIAQNPWSVLEARRVYLPVPDAAGGGATIPVFMNHYRNQGIA